MEIGRTKLIIIPLLLFYFFAPVCIGGNSVKLKNHMLVRNGFVNAADYGFSPEASGKENVVALQKAVDKGGTIVVSMPGTYEMAGTVYIGSNTSLEFGNNVFLKKVSEEGGFTHVLLNKGALTKTYDEHISVEGLNIIVNGVDKGMTEVFGLRGQIAFFYVKDLRIEHFRCLDLANVQFCIHVCTFEDLLINDVIIHGKKDGVHLGKGNRFTIKNAVFKCFDDAIALNAHDYATSNPELGWIENGIVENCYDLNEEKTTGYFCRILAGGWIDWNPGMEVQNSDAVVSNGRIYRIKGNPDNTIYKSVTRPEHEIGSQVLDGITWVMVQDDPVHSAGVRNVSFRNIFLEKPRTGFSIHFDNDRYSRSYYPGAEIPMQEQLTFDNIRVLHDQTINLISVNTPVDVFTISNSSIKDNKINFGGNKAMPDYLKTRINIYGCTFKKDGELQLVTNSVEGKEIFLKTSSNIEVNDSFSATVIPGGGKIVVESDLTGLKDRSVVSATTQQEIISPVWQLGRNPLTPSMKRGEMELADGIIKFDGTNSLVFPLTILGEQRDFTIEFEVKKADDISSQDQICLVSNAEEESKVGFGLRYFPPDYNAVWVMTNGYRTVEKRHFLGNDFLKVTLIVKDQELMVFKDGVLMATTSAIKRSASPLVFGEAKQTLSKPLEVRNIKIYDDAVFPPGFSESDDRMYFCSGANYFIERATIKDEKRPRILVVGNSISMGYRQYISKYFEGRAYVDYWVGGSTDQIEGENSEGKIAWQGVLANGPYDVVTWNSMALHYWQYPERLAEDKLVPQMTEAVRYLKEIAPKTQFIWVKTTPLTISEKGKPTIINEVKSARIVKFNQMTDEIMQKHGFSEVDLYNVCERNLDEASSDGIHWKAGAYQLMADEIIQEIEQCLPKEHIK